MPATSPDNIYYEDGTVLYSDATNASLQASSIQNALNLRQQYNFIWTNSGGRTGQTGMRNGDTGYQQDTQTLYTYNGSQWAVSGISPWTPWSPTTTGIAVGTGGTIISVYRFVGNKIELKFAVLFGTGGSINATNPSFTLPFAAETQLAPYTAYNGFGSAYNGSSIYPLFVISNNTSTTVAVFYALAASTQAFSNVSSTSPFTWASGHSLNANISYVPA